MTEKEAIEQSLKHWQENLSILEKINWKKLKREFPIWPHNYANNVLGIWVDGSHCDLCKFYQGGCEKCVLKKPGDSGNCCEEWRGVWGIIKLLATTGAEPSKEIIEELLESVQKMIKRLEHELENLEPEILEYGEFERYAG